ncbi:beta-glucoside-specific PTS transporter subunit IIABC [Bacillus cytotoxicus]|uniref:beta-glucoside-specific PTS transporter subunit IIABC n=1 Tax=Bacillus cytotoxicus TaxID=580165 RepID=UPI00244CA8F4|nr:beta-glucoside-specific PTS transporter subunit IIABC [Bacillus cytotoxicus]MDH2881788.1 beta-glucoside-specific PTS transporter subunit IIABC [Bacillus cytotoxicus]
MDYKNLAEKIINLVGGSENINEVTHCATRLRFVLNNKSKASDTDIQNLSGVKGISKLSDQYQIIIGTEVPHVYEAVSSMVIGNGDNERKNTNGGFFSRILGVLSGSITPMIPALTGAGLLKAFLALFVTLKWVSKESENYIILNFIADAAFYFMPIVVAYGAAKKFRVNPVLAMVVAGTLLHPNFSALVTDGSPLHFLGIPVSLVNYGSTIIPAILSTWLMSYVEKICEKSIPNFLKYFLKPLFAIAITSIITLLALAPLGNLIGNVVSGFIDGLNTYGTWIVPTVIGGLFPLLVMTGMHWSLAPFWLGQIAKNGFETLLGPGSLASNIAQGAASLAVALKTKDKEQKSIAASAGFTALMGITEPAMFGVTIKQKGILFSVMIGGLVGGLYAGLSGLVRYSAGGAGIALLPVFIGENPLNLLHALITMGISFIVTFAVTYLWGFKAEPETKPKPETKENTVIEKGNLNDTVTVTVDTPLNGEVIPLDKVNDEVFSKKMMGEGFAVIPRDGKLVSPVDGKVAMLFDTNHAIGIKEENDLEILIHIGIDTVNLKGNSFKAHVSQGEKVSKGQLLIEFGLDKIKNAGYDPTTMVVFTSSYKEIKDISFGAKNKNEKVSSITI